LAKQSEPYSATKKSKFDIETMFEFENKPVLIIVDDYGKIWFKGVDVITILEYQDQSHPIRKHVPQKHKANFKNLEFHKGGRYCPLSYMHPSTVFIDESGLYRLIMRSKMPKAEKFTDWVVKEVLPSIRKTGEYSMNDEEKDRLLELNARFLDMIN